MINYLKAYKGNQDRLPICKICGRKANEIDEYIQAAKNENSTPESIAKGDGTYNFMTNKFYCTTCYVKIGCPLGTA
jgi:hypothetical protein